MYSQENRFLELVTPLGPDVLLLTEFNGSESISTLFQYNLTMISENNNIDFEEIIGQNVSVNISLLDGSRRYFNGIIISFFQIDSGESEREAFIFSQYTAVMVPWAWLLTQTADLRIFQELSVPEIIEKIFNEKGFNDFTLKLHGRYDKKNYCVQYRETDFNFISRLMEEEGIFYFFEHEAGIHTMIITDSPAEHQACDDHEIIYYALTGDALHENEVISNLELGKTIKAGKITLNDYNFETPTAALKVDAASRVKLGPGEREFYDYPALYANRQQGNRLANIRMETEEARNTTISGLSNCRTLNAGQKFTLERYYRDEMNNKPYVLTEVTHSARQTGYRTGSAETSYSNSFTCIPHEVPYRPLRLTPKPVVEGVQTAIVVGPSGEEIYTDKHGRVKVQFHWDREGKKDEKSSCWIRVSQLWAGAGWGAMWIPRIGHEVIVDFEEGDPDRPIITGRVYHGNNRPPYPLPAEKTKSTIKSDSSLGGGGFNEFRFEDKKDGEEIFLHGQKDWTITIENDKNQTVGNDETLAVGNNRDKTVGNDQSEAIGKNKSIKVGTNHTEQIGSNKTMTVGANHTETIAVNCAETIGAAKELTVGAAYQVSVGAAMNETIGAAKAEEIGASKSVMIGKDLTEQVAKTYSHKAKKIILDAEDEITFKTGKASINMKKSGDITIKGKKITIKGSGNVVIKGKKILEN